MNGTFKHYLNEQLVDEPDGWDDFTQVIERNDELRFIGLKYEGAVTFYGGSAEYLRELRADNTCQIVSYRVTQECDGVDETAFEASIIMTEIEWNVNKCTATTTVADNSYGSYIINNADITLRPTSEKAKLGTDISPTPPIIVAVYDPNLPPPFYINVPYVSGQPGSPTMWDWKEAMSHAVRYMSEGVISGIVSEWYDGLDPQVENYAITTGYILRNPGIVDAAVQFDTSRTPLYSFNDLWQNLWKKYDLWSSIEKHYDGSIVLRVEQRDYFFGSSSAFDHNNQDDLIQGADQKALYGRVRVGSEITIRGAATDASLPFLFLRGFTEEDYHIPISCNTSEALDLVSSFVIDSNVIETVLIGGSDEYDDDVFMIQYGSSEITTIPMFAIRGDYILPGQVPYLYNIHLLNEYVLTRFTLLGAIQYITEETDGFSAELTAGPNVYRSYSGTFSIGTFQEPITPQEHRFSNDYPPDGEDPNNNYGNGTPQGTPVSEANSRYTASQQGLFGFEFNLVWQTFTMDPSLPLSARKPVALRVVINRYDAGNVLVETPYDVTSAYFNDFIFLNGVGIGPKREFHEPDVPVYMNVGDYVRLFFQFQIAEAPFVQTGINSWDYELRVYKTHIDTGAPGHPLRRSYWKTKYVAGQGGEIVASDPEDVYQNTFKYTRHIPLDAWLSLVGDLSQSVRVGPGQVPMLPGYARRLARNVNTGNTEVELIASTPNSFV